VVERFDLDASVWLEPIPINDYVFTLELAGDTILVGTYVNGIYLLKTGNPGNIPAGNEYGQCCRHKINSMISIQPETAALHRVRTSVRPTLWCVHGDCRCYMPATQLESKNHLSSTTMSPSMVVSAFIATDEGLQRYDLVNNTFLDTWGSTSSSRLNYAQVAVIGTTMNMGIEGFGVARKDILTGQSLSTLDSTTMELGTIMSTLLKPAGVICGLEPIVEHGFGTGQQQQSA